MTWPHTIVCSTMATLNVWAGTGPILPVRSADRLLDSFEVATAVYHVQTRGEAQPKLTRRSGIAKHGNTSLLIEMPATGDKGRNSLTMTWTFEQPADWSEFEGLSIWFQTHSDPAPTVTPWVFEASGGSYWWRGQTMLPRREGEWQLVEMPFKKWTWSSAAANGSMTWSSTPTTASLQT